jgi:hypothetical protein
MMMGICRGLGIGIVRSRVSGDILRPAPNGRGKKGKWKCSSNPARGGIREAATKT